MEKSPIKVVEKSSYWLFKSSADVQVSERAVRLGRAVLSGSLQFPPLIGLPAPCLLPISPRHSELGQNRTREAHLSPQALHSDRTIDNELQLQNP